MRLSVVRSAGRRALATGGVATSLLVATAIVAPSAYAAGLSAPPPGVEAGEVSLALTKCTFGPLVNQTLDATLKGTFDSVDGPGQQFDLTNGQGTLTIPANVVSAIYGLGGRSADGEITTIDMEAANATPATFNAAGSGLAIAKQTLVNNKALVIKIPQSGPPLTVGPFTAGSSGTITIGFGDTAGKFNVYNSSGQDILPNQTVKCPIPSPVVNMVTATIGGSGTGLNAPGAYKFASVSLKTGEETGAVTSNLACSGPDFPNVKLAGTYDITGPSRVVHGTSASGSGQLVVPASVVNSLIKLGASTVSGSITTLDIDTTDATPASINLASTPIAIGPLTLTANKALTVKIPPTGTLTGSATPTAAGLLTLGIGSSGGSVTLKNSSGGVVAQGALSCSAPSPKVVIGGVTVS